MELELLDYSLEELSWGERTVLDGKSLSLSVADLQQQIKDLPPAIHVDYELACPGESKRIVHVLDTVLPIAKLTGSSLTFPGFDGPAELVGSGRTARLKNILVTVAGRFPHPELMSPIEKPREGIIDMTGVGAAYASGSDYFLLIVSPSAEPSVSNAAFDHAIRTIALRSARYLAQAKKTRYFDNDQKRFEETIKNYNHKIKKIERLQEQIPVYDLEVPETHNFALASGVFVHNSAKQGRNREFQAILPLRGKILNVERARLDKMLVNNEIRNLIIALGTNIGEQFEMESLRYERIILMTDADVDGAHIRTLLLTLFYRYFPELIKQQHIFVAQPPLYRLSKGKESHYAYSDSEKEKIIGEMQNKKPSVNNGHKQNNESPQPSTSLSLGVEDPLLKRGNDETNSNEEISFVGGINIQRYKGLGEMNADQLWETTMNPETRVMRIINIDDAAKADSTFDVLMGSEVDPRKRFIQTHAKSVKNLDI